jgi:hypothetical protein
MVCPFDLLLLGEKMRSAKTFSRSTRAPSLFDKAEARASYQAILAGDNAPKSRTPSSEGMQARGPSTYLAAGGDEAFFGGVLLLEVLSLLSLLFSW